MSYMYLVVKYDLQTKLVYHDEDKSDLYTFTTFKPKHLASINKLLADEPLSTA